MRGGHGAAVVPRMTKRGAMTVSLPGAFCPSRRARAGRTSAVTGQDARAALSIARAAIQSVITGIPVRIDELKAE
jgi:hypothetical protein